MEVLAMKNIYKKALSIGFLSGLLLLGSNAEANCVGEYQCFTTECIAAWKMDKGNYMEYYAKKKQEVLYQCKICNRTFKTKLVAMGHVKGNHHKFFTLPHIRTIKS